MNLIQAAVQTFLPPKRKNTPSGWISFNAPCCHNRGESMDDRKRGGMLFNNDGFQYHCFNCNFKAGWTPGKLISKNSKSLFAWMGMPEQDIQKLSLEALKSKEDLPKAIKTLTFDLHEIALPADCKKFTDIATQGCTDEDFLNVVEYVVGRGMELTWYDWMWCPEPGYRDRVIVPFYQEGKIVGFTGRKIKEGKPKYLTEGQGGYVFNVDRQSPDRKYVIVVEGQFDAIAVDGVAVMTNELNDTQIARIKMLGKEVIIVPDRDKPGAKMIKIALEQGWSVSLPPWGDDVKDVADAVKQYGRLYTLSTILHYRETNEIKIQLLKKKIESNG